MEDVITNVVDPKFMVYRNGPLYDAEFVVPGCKEIRLFNRPYGIDFADFKATKGIADTNVQQSSCLPMPCSHSTESVRVKFSTMATKQEECALLAWSHIELVLRNRIMLRLPLQAFYPNVFRLNTDQFNIKPQESFGVIIAWNTPPQIVRPIKIYVYLDGCMNVPR